MHTRICTDPNGKDEAYIPKLERWRLTFDARTHAHAHKFCFSPCTQTSSSTMPFHPSKPNHTDPSGANEAYNRMLELSRMGRENYSRDIDAHTYTHTHARARDTTRHTHTHTHTHTHNTHTQHTPIHSNGHALNTHEHTDPSGANEAYNRMLELSRMGRENYRREIDAHHSSCDGKCMDAISAHDVTLYVRRGCFSHAIRFLAFSLSLLSLFWSPWR